MEYLFIILFIYASYLSIEKYVHTGSIFTWRGRKDRKERRATPVTIHPAASSSETEIIGKSRYQIRQSLTIDDNSGQPEQAVRVLQRVSQTGVPGTEEARQRIERLRTKKAGVS